MLSLFVYQETNCQCIRLDGPIQLDQISIFQRQEHWIVQAGSITRRLGLSQPVSIEGRIFILQKETWSMVFLQEGFIGRNQAAQYCWNSTLLSNVHAKLIQDVKGWSLEDCQSKNGTYVNGKRIQRVSLKDGDQVCMATVRFFFFSSFLYLNHEIETKAEIPYVNRRGLIPWTKHSLTLKDDPELFEMEVELPIPTFPMRKASLFATLGSSLTIVCSSCSMALLLYLTKPEQIEQVQTMLYTSASMFFAFALFGLLNRRSQNKDNAREQQEAKEKYLLYLQDKSAEVWAMREAVLKSMHTTKNACTTFHEASFGRKYPIWIGSVSQPWLTIKHSSISYLQKNDELIVALEQQSQHWQQAILKNQFLEENACNVFDGRDGFLLFTQWLWTHPDSQHKWIWLSNRLSKEHRVFAFPYCQIGNQRLLACSKEEWERLEKNLDRKYSYTIFSTLAINPWSKPCTWIDAQNAKFSQTTVDFRSLLEHTQASVHPDFLVCTPFKPWDTNTCTLKVPIGWDEKNHLIHLDFHDGKQGPHGIIAGMTGSGKSEWLTSVLMHLILRNSPERFQYLLVDFKGGAFGQAFYAFPHCAGMVTNLDRQSIERWMLSMEAELLSRQEKLQNFLKEAPSHIAHIDAYNAVHTKAISHLFVIFDEYAEFKSQFPDCAMRVKEMARIGRSLGIHLLISTQKPLGVIDEQIWANSNFQVCLKVNSEADSKEVIHDPRAAHLKQVGTFILHNNQSWQEGQGFWLQEKRLDKAHPDVYELDDNDQIIFAHKVPQKNLLEVCSAWIGQQHAKRHWVLQPNLDETTKVDQLLIVDDPQHQKQCEFTLEKGKVAFIYWENQNDLEVFVHSCMAYFKNEVLLCMGDSSFDMYVDARIDAFSEIGQEEGTLFVFTPSKDLYKPYRNPRMRILYFICQPWLNIHTLADCFLALAWNDLDQVRTFFNQMKIPKIDKPQYGLFQCKADLLTFYIPKRKPRKRKVSHKKAEVFVLGRSVDAQERVEWKRENPLLILYVQKSCGAWIEKLLQQWLTINPLLDVEYDFSQLADITICTLPESLNHIQTSALYQANQYDYDILWVGLGLADYTYLIKRKCPYTQNGQFVYWTNQTMVEGNYV